MNLINKMYSNSPIFIQNFILNAKAAELYVERYGLKFKKRFDAFMENQWKSFDDMNDYQNENLIKIITHAYHTVPYYNQIMKNFKLSPKDIQKKEDLSKLPVLTKDQIKTNFKDFISSEYKGIRLRHGHTSGTTGSPMDVCYDINTCVVHHAADWRQKAWAGLEYGQPYASIQGRVIVPLKQKKPPFWRKNYINNQLFLSSFHLTEKNLPFYFDKLEKDGIRYIEGYPSTLYILALYLNKHKQTFPLNAVFTSSETLFDYQKDAIERAFTCRVFDFYGMAERCVFATECDHHQGLHLNMDYGITEFLDQHNEPVGKGRLGRIIATSLHNYAMPLIRYQTNDSCALKAEKCTCDRNFPLMEGVATKNESIVTLPDGRLVSPSVLTHPFKPIHTIKESQIIQEDLNRFVVKIVKSNDYTEADEKRLVAGFQERLGNEIQIEVQYVDAVPRTDSGKFKWVVSKIQAKF